MYNYGPAAYNWSRLTAAAGHAAHAAHLKSEWPTSADYMAASLQQHSDLSHHYAAAHYNMTGKKAVSECTACRHRIAHRKWKETKLLPGTAGPGNRLGCCLIYLHFLWAILCPQAVLDLPQTFTSFFMQLHICTMCHIIHQRSLL